MKAVNVYDYVVIGLYFLFMLGIGLYFMKINKGAKEYFAGGSMIPWWVSGMTLYMANFSAWTFTGAAGFAYSHGVVRDTVFRNLVRCRTTSGRR